MRVKRKLLSWVQQHCAPALMRDADVHKKNYLTVTFGSSIVTVDDFEPIVPVALKNSPADELPRASPRPLSLQKHLMSFVASYLPYQRPRPYQPPPSSRTMSTMTRSVVISICGSYSGRFAISRCA